jgi:hypothetical protein
MAVREKNNIMLPGNRWRLLETTGGRDVRFKVCQRKP